jgi:biopolymer transport protein TolR
MGMAVGGPGGGPKADINMTPMIDVLLVLIIIFMVITPLTPKGLEALVPQPPPIDTPPNQSERTVVIVIDANHQFTINQEPWTEDKLGGRLTEIFKTRAERVVFVKGDPSLEFQWVAKAIDIARGAGIDKVGLMTASVRSDARARYERVADVVDNLRAAGVDNIGLLTEQIAG